MIDKGTIVERDWITSAGLRAACLLVNFGSHRCGYVEVPKDHPLYRVSYNENAPVLVEAWEKVKGSPIGNRGLMSLLISLLDTGKFRPDVVFDVHGCLTYSGGGGGYPVESDGWWFGFDCAHFGDQFDHSVGHWWTEEEVVDQCENLARQIVEAVPWP